MWCVDVGYADVPTGVPLKGNPLRKVDSDRTSRLDHMFDTRGYKDFETSTPSSRFRGSVVVGRGGFTAHEECISPDLWAEVAELVAVELVFLHTQDIQWAEVVL
jgi:hypothetical protein